MKVSSTVINHWGIPFCAVRIEPGEPYGNIVNGLPRLVAKEPLIEVYDERYPHTDLGQFVSRYYVETLRNHPWCGIALDLGVPEWELTADNVATIRRELFPL